MHTAIGLAVVMALSVVAPAAAQTREQNVKWCTSRDSTADLRIGGCTALIQAGGETAADMATIFADRGLGYFDKAEYIKAKADFEQGIRLNPSSALAVGGRARVMAVQQQFDAALAEHTRAIALAETAGAPFQYWLRGMTYLDAKKYPEALLDLNLAIALKPDYGHAYFQRGRVYYAQDDFVKSIADFTTSLRLDPSEFTAYYNRGLCYANTREYDKAIADFDVLLKTDPTNVDGFVERGRAYFSKEEYAKALVDLSQAIALSPANQEAVFTRARVYYAQSNYDLSIADNTTAIALDATDHVAYFNRGLAFFGKQDYPRAIADFDKAITMKPDYLLPLRNRGRAYYMIKQYDKSLDDFTRVIALAPKDGDAFYYRSITQAGAGRTELALADIQTAVALQPGDAADLIQRASVYQRLRLFQLADNDYAAIIKNDPKRTVLTASLKALNRTMLDQTAEAVIDCNALLASSPDHHGINETCGMVYLKAGDLDRALAGFDKAQAGATPADAQPLFGRGLVKLKKGQLADAKLDLDKAVAIDPTIADYYARFGLIR